MDFAKSVPNAQRDYVFEDVLVISHSASAYE